MLLELQVSLFLTVILLMLLVSCMRLGWQSWNTLSSEIELRDVSRYMFSRLEKDIGIAAVSVDVQKNGTVLELYTVENKQVIRFYCDKERLYRKVLTRAGSGVNPLYVNDIYVEQLRAERVDSRSLLVSYWLRAGTRREYFQSLIYCYNGVVNAE